MNKYILLLVLALCTVEVKAASDTANMLCDGNEECAAGIDFYIYKVVLPNAALYLDCEDNAKYRKQNSVDCANATILLSDIGKHGREAEKYFGAIIDANKSK